MCGSTGSQLGWECAQEQGKVQEEVRHLWRRWWGLEIINQGGEQLIRAELAS